MTRDPKIPCHRLFVWLALCIAPGTAISAAAPAVDIPAFIDAACLKYETTFTVPASPGLWGRVLDNPYVMGKLWEAYGFTPAYRTVPAPGGMRVSDPTGLDGTLYVLGTDRTRRTLYARGRMKNWYIPLALRGAALFFIETTGAQDTVSVRFTVYGEGGDSVVMRVLLKAAAPLLGHYIDRRVTANLRDLNVIINDIAEDPARTAHRLHGPDRILYERAFVRDPSTPPELSSAPHNPE